MSAFIMSDETTNAIVSFFLCNRRLQDEEVFDADRMLRTLVIENYHSVNYLYHESEKPVYKNFLMQYSQVQFDPLDVWYQCRCYHYQSCEADDYEESEAARFVNRVEVLCKSILGIFDDDKLREMIDHLTWGDITFPYEANTSLAVHQESL